jgi:hypothetical protein
MNDLPAQVEPRLNAWLARLLGDPARYRFYARVLQQVDTGTKFDGRPVMRWDDTGNTLEAGLDELGLSPLSLVLGSEPQTSGGQSGVQERLAALLRSKAAAAFGAAASAMAVVLQADAPAGAPAGSLGLVEFESFCWLLHRLLDKTRALRRMDMVHARDNIEPEATQTDGEYAGVDLAELQARLDLADAQAAAVLAALDAAVAAVPAEPELLDPAAPATQALLAGLQGALAQASALGWRSALASQAVAAGGSANGQGEQVTPGDSVAAAHARAAALRAEVGARRDAAPLPDGADRLGLQVRKLVDRIRAILGKSFPVLPVFNFGAHAAEAAPSLARRNELLDGDDLAIAGWLPKLGAVREATGLLSDALTAAEALGLPTQGSDFKLLQVSTLPVKRWGALPPDAEDDLRGVLAVVAHAPGALAEVTPEDGVAGLYVDEWMEALPATQETTGLSFHFDAPGARAPQSMLLAVPHDKSLPNWTLDALLGVVDEALSLARLRAVRPQDLQGVGLLLPGLFLSENFKRDVPSVGLKALVEKNLGAIRAAYGENTPKSFMHMAAGKSIVSE